MISPIKKNIGKLKNNKSPGVESFPGEFCNVFINELTPILCRIYNYALEKGDPTKSWAEAEITVIHKAGKDPTQCIGYRPIYKPSLLGFKNFNFNFSRKDSNAY